MTPVPTPESWPPEEYEQPPLIHPDSKDAAKVALILFAIVGFIVTVMALAWGVRGAVLWVLS